MNTEITATVEHAPVVEMTVEQLEALLEKRKAAERKAKEKAKNAYLEKREMLINDLSGFAVSLQNQMMDLKYEAFSEITKFREMMLEYGDIRGGENNKGSFELKNDNYKIRFMSQVNKCFDERAELAEKKLKEFLATFVKKANKSAYMIIMALLERNSKTGDFDINLINRLYAMREQFNNPLWIEALDMFQESYSPYGTAQYIQFYKKDPNTNGWLPIVLDFAKLRMATEKDATDNTKAA